MNKKNFLAIVGVAFLINGCALDNLRTLSFFHKTKAKKESIKTSEKKAIDEYKPVVLSKETSKRVKSIKKIKKVKIKSKVKKIHNSKKSVHKKIHKHKPKKLKPEPFSIKSHKADPELLGPQTTLSNNPINKLNKKVKSTTSNKM